MATYNGEKHIREAIQSVLDQDFRDFEFIIVDDGSTDSTANIIASYTDDRIYYIKKETNSGIADSLNIGIQKAKGKYIARMDDDDICLPHRLETQLHFLEHNPQIILCGSAVINPITNEVRVNKMTHDDIVLEMLFKNPITHPSVFCKREVMLGQSYNPEMVPSEDYDLWSRLIGLGELHNLEEPLLYYRVHQKSETSRRRREQLALNVTISNRIFKAFGFNSILHHDESVRVLASHDYTVKGVEIRRLLAWKKNIVQFNKDHGIFDQNKFYESIEETIYKFIIAYFTNRKLSQKIEPFFNLDSKTRKKIINYYLQSLFKGYK
jgi:glycosyltransferase involved in cell wall biosynthesis